MPQLNRGGYSQEVPVPVVSLLNPDLSAKLGRMAAEIALLQLQRRLLMQEAVDYCSHPINRIYLYENREGLGFRGPWLVCAECGYSEQGWGIGYDKLKYAAYRDVPKITREQWLATSTVRVAQELSSGDD